MSKVTKKFIELRDNNLIEQQEYFKLKPTGTPPARFYGLPKIHKDGTPMRPVVSYTGTPLYEISKYITNILKPYGKLEEQHTHSSKSFSAFTCQQKIEPDEIMVKMNFLDNLKCLSEVLQLQRGRGLSLSGKILVLNTLPLSRLLYACTMKIPSKQLIDQL